MKIDKKLVVGAALVGGAFHYKKFIDFVDALKLSFTFLGENNGYLNLVINSINKDKIPFKIESIDLIVNKKKHLAKSNSDNANLSIIRENSKPIVFQLLDKINEDELEQVQISIKFSIFYGMISATRLYDAKLIRKKDEDINIHNNYSEKTQKSSCGCGC